MKPTSAPSIAPPLQQTQPAARVFFGPGTLVFGCSVSRRMNQIVSLPKRSAQIDRVPGEGGKMENRFSPGLRPGLFSRHAFGNLPLGYPTKYLVLMGQTPWVQYGVRAESGSSGRPHNAPAGYSNERW